MLDYKPQDHNNNSIGMSKMRLVSRDKHRHRQQRTLTVNDKNMSCFVIFIWVFIHDPCNKWCPKWSTQHGFWMLFHFDKQQLSKEEKKMMANNQVIDAKRTKHNPMCNKPTEYYSWSLWYNWHMCMQSRLRPYFISIVHPHTIRISNSLDTFHGRTKRHKKNEAKQKKMRLISCCCYFDLWF